MGLHDSSNGPLTGNILLGIVVVFRRQGGLLWCTPRTVGVCSVCRLLLLYAFLQPCQQCKGRIGAAGKVVCMPCLESAGEAAVKLDE